MSDTKAQYRLDDDDDDNNDDNDRSELHGISRRPRQPSPMSIIAKTQHSVRVEQGRQPA